jgi:hypothetical protein
MTRAVFAMLSALILSGCWMGPPFYSQNETVTAIPAGNYRIRHIEDPTGQDQRVDEEAASISPFAIRVRIAYRRDGLAMVSNPADSDDPQPATIVPLNNTPGYENIYVVQIDAPSTGRAVYGIVNVTADGYQLAMPVCDGTRRLTAGQPVFIGGLLGKRTCTFKSRTDLEAAMREFVKDPIRWTDYRRYQ